MQRPRTIGLVLAGGLGRRMSDDGAGIDKGLEPFRSRPMVEHVIGRLAPQVDEVWINANRNLERYARFGCRLVPDALPGFAGPLAGLHAAMLAASGCWIATAPCDSPLLPGDLVDRLWQALRPGRQPPRIAIARCAGREQPVFMLADAGLLDTLEAFLASGRRRIDAWYGALPHLEVDFPDEQAFRNINTRQELLDLE
jgi:molybdenum cofactor guanylyltransferase